MCCMSKWVDVRDVLAHAPSQNIGQQQVQLVGMVTVQQVNAVC